MTPRTRGYTLVEVLVAGAILLTGLLPVLHLVTTGSTQAVKARDRAVAMFLAASVAEERRLTPAVARTDLPPTAAGLVPHLKELVDAQKASDPTYDGAALDRTLANYTVSATVTGVPPLPLRVVVEWRESGEPRQHVLDGTLGGP